MPEPTTTELDKFAPTCPNCGSHNVRFNATAYAWYDDQCQLYAVSEVYINSDAYVMCMNTECPGGGEHEAIEYFGDDWDPEGPIGGHYYAEDAAADPVTAIADMWADDEQFPRVDWKYEVNNNDTNLGYWEWLKVKQAIEEDATP